MAPLGLDHPAYQDLGNGVEVTDWATSVAAAFAGIGLFFTGVQVRRSRRQEAFERRVALDGVAVSWEAITAPDHPDADGTAEWLYRVIVHNPARLPIDQIRVRWVFPCEVRRVRYSGRLGDPTEVLTFQHPVLAGLDKKEWARRLRIDYSCASELRRSYTFVTFRDVGGVEHKNRWPRELGS
jgi:hypothetical protein